MDKEIEVKGTITDKIFYNEENGYIVAVFETPEEQFTIVGNMPGGAGGSEYILKGNFIEHKKYGEQFSFSSYQEVMPTTEEGIKSFLSSKLIKGIGPKTAEAIVAKFGLDTLDIIEKDPKRLKSVSGIGESKAKEISEALKEHMEFANVTMFLKEYGIKAELILKIYNTYGSNTIALIKLNPYNLIEDVRGIGFKKADEIARDMGVEEDDEKRITSGIKYILNMEAQSGHCYIPRCDLLEKTAINLGVSSERADEVLINMAFSSDVMISRLVGQEVVYLAVNYKAEQNVTKKLFSLTNSNLKPLCIEVDNLINQTEYEMGISYSKEQKSAMKTCLDNGVSVITGGPGTGKTTIINGILNILSCGGFKTAIAAPTGRAAKRIMETTAKEAYTIHRLLEYYFDNDAKCMRFGKNENEKLEYDAIIIDEASMVDIVLMSALLDAISDGTRLILVGDADQLPSVGVGNVLRDILDSEYIYAVRLTRIFRQAQESMIVVNAHRINKGEYPEYQKEGSDFFFMRRNSEKNILETILQLCVKRLPNYYKLKDRIQDVQVITPTKKGILGSNNLNKELQKVLNPKSDFAEEREMGGRVFREYDKVMQIKNNYELEWRRASDMTEGTGVFNGEIGFISKIDKEQNKVTVVFDGDRYVIYDFMNLEELELAYAMTVHKSQGSEFPVVVMPMTRVAPMLATRNLLYTGVTRGKKAVVLVGSENAMKAMIDNNSTKKRNSGLAMRIKRLYEVNK